jgi:hypothetical protein
LDGLRLPSPADFGGTLPINASSSRTITIPGWPASCANCNYSFTVTLDTADAVCECRENNNSTSQSSTITIPDIEVSGEALSVTCLADGQSLVSGTVTLANNGCGSALTANIPVRLTLYSAPSCGGSQLDQWTQTFTGVNIPARGSQTFTIASHQVSKNLCELATNCGVSLNVEADYTGSICECDGTDNTRCSATKEISYPDLAVTDIDFSGVSCSGDNISGSVAVTVENRGCGPAGPFKVTLETDGCPSFSEQTVPGPSGRGEGDGDLPDRGEMGRLHRLQLHLHRYGRLPRASSASAPAPTAILRLSLPPSPTCGWPRSSRMCRMRALRGRCA